jgi:osmotically-inducible protein OsmY
MVREEQPVQKPDDEIRAAVQDALMWDPRVNSFEVIVRVSGGRVTLRGTVDNLKAKRAAAEDAWNTTGVGLVRNHVRVRPEDEVTDEAVALGVRSALLWDPFVEKYEITVGVDDGVVELKGEVDTYFEKARADDVASRVKGVRSVDNELVVHDDLLVYDPFLGDPYIYDFYWYDYEPEWTVRKADDFIEENIEDELWWSPFVDEDDVEVSVTRGIATLTGAVDSYSERRIATENALEGGAVMVHNRLRVQ